MRLLLACSLAAIALAADGDLHLLPQAAGSGDGSSWAHAQAASGPGIAAALAKLPPGAAVRLGSGTYAGLSVAVQAAGASGKPVAIRGEDTGGGLPLLTGSWRREDPAHGPIAISLRPGTSHVEITGLRLSGYQEGVSIRDGGVSDVRFADLRMESMRSGFELAGGTDAAKPESWNEGLLIERCHIVNYTKRGIRFRRGNRSIQVRDCLADGGGKAWAVEPWQTGFALEGDRNAAKEQRTALPDHDITFERCTAMGNYNDRGDGYWNADGFSAEGGNSGLVYIDCRASDNTDGGWDDKSAAPKLVRCTAERNKRNYRFWNRTHPPVMQDCRSGEAVKLGGSGDAAAIWLKGGLLATGCTFLAQPKVLSLDGAEAGAAFVRCTFVAGAAGGVLWSAAQTAQVREEDCVRQGALVLAGAGEAAGGGE